jgi:hypothetical protein
MKCKCGGQIICIYDDGEENFEYECQKCFKVIN